MAENGYGGPGHIGRIPNYGKTQVNPMGFVEPPACIQNAMMTKDKKPFTYTPGGLDLSQIKTPSMARRLNRQRSQEEQEQAYGQQYPNGGNYHPQGGPAPPPPPPPQVPAPPPPPPLVISVPKSKSPNPKPIVPGERPEIVIPENPIGMLRKTNSPYHWESEKAQMDQMGPVPKFVEKAPSPANVQMGPQSFTKQPPQNYQPNNVQRQNYPYANQTPSSPVHKPEPQYANQNNSPNMSSSPLAREVLQRQDSQVFNKSPQPFSGQSPINGSSFPQNIGWNQPERRDSPAKNVQSPQSPQQQQFNRGPFSPVIQQSPNSFNQNQAPPQQNNTPVYHTLPRAAPKQQEQNLYNNVQNNNNAIYNNTNQTAQSPRADPPASWRTQTLNRQKGPDNVQNIYHNSQPNNQQPTYSPPWRGQDVNNNQSDQNYIPPWNRDNKPAGNQVINDNRQFNQIQNQQPQQKPIQNQNQQQQLNQQQYSPPWAVNDSNNNRVRETMSPPWRNNNQETRSAPAPPPKPQPQEQPRYQSTMSIPVTPRNPRQPEPRKNSPQKEIVYVTQEPVYYCPDSPKATPAWVKEKTKTPPPEWCQRPLDNSPRELYTPPREAPVTEEPEWVKKSNEMQRGMREVISPPKYYEPVQPTWSTKPSDNRKSIPKDEANGNRTVPVQVDSSQGRNNQPHLRITIGSQPNPQSYSQPTQRIMRVLSPQLVRMDDPTPQHDLPTLNRNFQNQQDSSKTRIIPIQIEGGGNDAQNRSFGGRF